MDGNIETGAVERFEHDFCSVFAVFGRVKRRLGEQEVVVFGLDAEVFEYRVGPVAFHVVPVLYLTVADGVV